MFKENELLKVEWNQSSLSMANLNSTQGHGSVWSSYGQNQNRANGFKFGLTLSSLKGGLNFTISAYTTKSKPVAAKSIIFLIDTCWQQMIGMKL